MISSVVQFNSLVYRTICHRLICICDVDLWKELKLNNNMRQFWVAPETYNPFHERFEKNCVLNGPYI